MGIKANPIVQFIIIAYVFIIAHIEVSICFPAIMAIAKHFSCTENIAKLILNINYLSLGIAGLLVGFIADQIGRKKIMVIGAVLFTISSLICYMSTSIGYLIFGRIIQGLSASIPMVLTGVIIFDLFGAAQNATRYFAIGNALNTVCMAIAPILGQYITYHYGWQNIFLLLTIMSFISCILLLFYFTETKHSRGKIKYKNIIRDYIILLLQPKFTLSMLSWSVLVSVIFFYLFNYVFLFVKYIDYPINKIGNHQFYIMSCFCIFSIVSSMIQKKTYLSYVLGWGAMTLSMLIAYYCVLFNQISYLSVTLFMMLFLSGNSLLIAPLTTRAIMLSEGSAGKGMALLHSAKLLLIFAIVSLNSMFCNNSFISIITIITSLSFISFIFHYLSYRLSIFNKIKSIID